MVDGNVTMTFAVIVKELRDIVDNRLAQETAFSNVRKPKLPLIDLNISEIVRKLLVSNFSTNSYILEH